MTTEMSSAPICKEPLRVISIAWGEKYVDEFLDLCLPALLAPGNLPVLAENFSAELVFVTEQSLFERVVLHPTYKEAAKVCPVRLIPLDDLVATRGSYGMSITYAFFRGFEDLGPAMTDCYLVFVHADFILADGSYRGLLPHLLRGERLVFSPSYCAVSEEVKPLLLAAQDPGRPVISVPPRRMAEMVLRHRHLSVRAKTVNQQFFSVEPMEQFYWVVNEHTLLVRQFPVALVAMKPERHLAELRSYWDYGVIADFCPSMKYTALSDSDDYLMLELRERDNPKGTLKLGWPSTEDIAKGLLSVITDYTAALGQARFTLHSGDISPEVEAAHVRLDNFVRKILTALPATLPSHHDHVQWGIHYPRFLAARAGYLERQAQAGGSPEKPPNANLRTGTADFDYSIESTSLAEEACLASVAALGKCYASFLPHQVAATLELALRATAKYVGQKEIIDRQYESLIAIFDQRGAAQSRSDEVSARMGALKHLVSDLEQTGGVIQETIRAFLDLNLDDSRGRIGDIVSIVQPPQRQSLRAEPATAFHRLSYLVFGAAGRYRRWHYKYSTTIHAVEISNACLMNDTKDVLLIQAGSSIFRIPDKVRSVEVVPLDPILMRSKLRQELNSGKKVDCCLIDAETSTLSGLRGIYDMVRPLLRPGGVIIGIFHNTGLADFKNVDTNYIDRAFPVCGPSRVIYSGSWASVAAFKVRHGVSAVGRYLRLPATVCIGLGMTAAAPFALMASRIEAKREPEDESRVPRKYTAVTVVINVG